MEEKKIVCAYTVKRYEDGSTDVEDAKLDGTTEMKADAIYRDIEEVAKLIEFQRYSNAAYQGIARFYTDAEEARAAEAAKTEENK